MPSLKGISGRIDMPIYLAQNENEVPAATWREVGANEVKTASKSASARRLKMTETTTTRTPAAVPAPPTHSSLEDALRASPGDGLL